MIRRYRKKPVVIEALQWTGQNHDEIARFIGRTFGGFTGQFTILPDGSYSGDEIFIHTLEGKMAASIGDYIIKGVKGEFYPCKSDIFKATYEEVQS